MYSVTSVCLLLFLGYVSHSIWTLIGMFSAPVCPKTSRCYKSYLSTKPTLDLYLFLTDNSRSGNIESIFTLEKFNYHERLEIDIPIKLTRTARNNGSLFIHSVIVPHKNRFDADLQDLVKAEDVVYLKEKLTDYTVPKSATFNLLNDELKSSRTVPVTHLKSKYGILMCTEPFEISKDTTPLELIQLIRINSRQLFLPIVDKDIMSDRLGDLREITSDMKNATFRFTFTPVSVGKLRFVSQISMALKQFLDWGFTEKDLDELKGVFADTNLYLLCATMLIGSIHLLLDFLTFKNDVSFWKSQSSMAGLSSTSVFWRAFSQTIVFLYLMDEKTSLLVLIPNFVATIIEFWKVSKVLKRTIKWQGGFTFDKITNESKEELETKKYESECMIYLSYVLYPLCISGAIYSLIYQPHKSWYSWTINSLVNAVYAFGFLFMLPQLFINYRLKSVAAMPWRAFTYRAFNTFIDDIFAFIITMPTAHRVACFRDDIVFLIYLYQRWLYPVDKNRVDDMAGESVPESSTALEKNKEE